MKIEASAERPLSHLPPHHMSETIKKEMDKANKQPCGQDSFLGRLQKMKMPRSHADRQERDIK